MAGYVPSQGDFVILTFDPQAGHEQKGRRPALVVSVDTFNSGIGMAFCCPITNTDRKTPFHLQVPDGSSLTGFVMCEQLKSLDYKARKLKLVEKAPVNFLNDVLAVIDACLFPPPTK